MCYQRCVVQWKWRKESVGKSAKIVRPRVYHQDISCSQKQIKTQTFSIVDDSGTLWQGTIVTLPLLSNNSKRQSDREHIHNDNNYYRVCAVFTKHYNKFWLSGKSPQSSRGNKACDRHKETKVLLCHVTMLFDGLNGTGRAQDVVPTDQANARHVFCLVKLADLQSIAAFYEISNHTSNPISNA